MHAHCLIRLPEAASSSPLPGAGNFARPSVVPGHGAVRKVHHDQTKISGFRVRSNPVPPEAGRLKQE